MQRISTIAVSVLAAGLMSASPAFALKAGDSVLGLGIASINPDAKTGAFSSSGTAPYAAGFQASLAGASADVSSEVTASLGLLHMYTDSLGLEATIGVPPKHKVDLTTPVTSTTHSNAATLKQWSPTIVGKYFFGGSNDKFRPYLGLGASYVSFHDIKINRSDAAVVQIAGGSISLDSKLTPVYNAGFVYEIDERWSFNASVSYLPIRTKLTTGDGLGAPGVSVSSTGKLDLNTTDYVFRIGYKF